MVEEEWKEIDNNLCFYSQERKKRRGRQRDEKKKNSKRQKTKVRKT